MKVTTDKKRICFVQFGFDVFRSNGKNAKISIDPERQLSFGSYKMNEIDLHKKIIKYFCKQKVP
jgi:hypothetical protein